VSLGWAEARCGHARAAGLPTLVSVLILPPGHAQELRARRQFSAREKWLIGAILGTVAALVLVVGISLGTAGHSSGNGCIDVTIPYAVGGIEYYRCGAAARSLCSQVGAPGGFSDASALAVSTECRKVGIPVGPG
jgi:hypothetical protein